MKTMTISVLVVIGVLLAGVALAHPHIMRIADRSEIAFEDMIEELKDVQLVFVGELHDHPGHHQAQLEIIDALREAGVNLAIGLEMFRSESQPILDRWNTGELNEQEFLPHYRDNWSLWPKYRKIFFYARDKEVPMVGLNISREITRQVASEGFDSLSSDQAQALNGITCNVDPIYIDYIRRAMGGHGGDGASFIYFCEAQLVWDNAMAKSLTDFLDGNPEKTVVVLAGSGHSWKYGVPAQVQNYGGASYRVVLPEIPGRVDRSNAKETDADYLWLDVGDSGWESPN